MVQGAVAVLGWVLPMAWLGIRAQRRLPEEAPWQMEGPSPAPWLWALVGIAALALRFWRLKSFIGFPLLDEGTNAYYALKLDESWNWRPFFFTTQLPPFYIWLLAAGFKIEPSLGMLWLLPALLSLGAAGVAYGAARTFFPKQLSFLIFTFAAVDFWPVYLGRFSHQAALLYFWEWLCLGALGAYGKAPSLKKAALMGFLIGCGFYTYFAWPLAALVLLPAAGVLLYKRPPPGSTPRFWIFGGMVLLPLLPLVPSLLTGGYGRYFLSRTASPAAWSLPEAWRYYSILFWGTSKSEFTYGPLWGGYLNPIMDAFVFCGAVEAWRARRHPLAPWLGGGFLVLTIPLLFSVPLNGLRLTPLIPLAAFLSALGFQSLSSPGRWVSGLLAGLALLSLGLDAANLQKSGEGLRSLYPTQRPPEYAQACGILESTAREKGPGLIFDDFLPGNRRLSYFPVGCYAFNGVDNPRVKPEDCRWVGLLANPNYKPFLDRRFPGGEAFLLNKENPPPDGGLMLWVNSLSPAGLETFRKWKEASLALAPLEEKTMERVPDESLPAFLKPLQEAYPFFRGDPFLESFYWDKMSELRFNQVLLESYRAQTGQGWADMPSGSVPEAAASAGRLRESIQDLQQAVQKGCPAAHLYYRLGVLYALSGQGALARQAFQKAQAAPLNLTDAGRFLKPKAE